MAGADTTSERRSSYCSVPLPGLAFVCPSTRAEFDRIPLPATVHEWRASSTETVLRNDGCEYEQQCTAKTLADGRRGGIEVVFQWFEYRPIQAAKEVA